MAKYKGWKNKYSYLDNYKRGMDGKYVYYGPHHVFQGTEEERRRYKWILGGVDILAAAIFVICGLMNAGAVWYTWYSVLPYAFEALAIFLLIWKSVSLIIEKHPVKSYIYHKTVRWFRPLAMILMILAFVCAATVGLCMILQSELVRVTGCVIYIVLQVVLAAGAFLFARILEKYSWEEDPAEV